jgi:hypothetical protein
VSDTTNITPGSVDIAFPEAGKDNDSQGFRNNFSAIKDSLTGAAGYIATLQDDTAKTTAANNHAGNNIVNANFVQISNEANIGAVSNTTSTQTLDFEEAAYYELTFSADCTVQIRNLLGASASPKHSVMQVLVRMDSTLAAAAAAKPVLSWDVGAGNVLWNDGNALWDNFELNGDDNNKFIMVQFESNDGGLRTFGRIIGEFSV